MTRLRRLGFFLLQDLERVLALETGNSAPHSEGEERRGKERILKFALLLENDADACFRMTRALMCFGYVVASVKTPSEAVNVVGTMRFDLIVTCTTETANPADRRSLTGELKRSAPDAAIVLAEDDSPARSRSYAGVNAVLRRPVCLDTLRQTLEYRLDCILQPAILPVADERRKY